MTQVLGITVDPQISSSASFPCPISASDIQVRYYGKGVADDLEHRREQCCITLRLEVFTISDDDLYELDACLMQTLRCRSVHCSPNDVLEQDTIVVACREMTLASGVKCPCLPIDAEGSNPC